MAILKHSGAELDDLVQELKEVNSWIPFGLMLGIKMPTLEAIQIENDTIADRRLHMLSHWNKQVTPTWSAVIQALRTIGMSRLASELAEKHGWLSMY